MNKHESKLLDKKWKAAHAKFNFRTYRHSSKTEGNHYKRCANNYYSRQPKGSYVNRMYKKRITKRELKYL